LDWILLGLFVCLFVFPDRVSLCSLGCPGTHSVDQAGLQFRNLPASASEVLGLMACTALLYYLNTPPQKKKKKEQQQNFTD